MSIFKKIGKSLFGTLRAVLCISTFIFVCFVRDTTYLMSPTLLGGDYIIAFQQILGRRIWEEDSFGRLTVHREEGTKGRCTCLQLPLRDGCRPDETWIESLLLQTLYGRGGRDLRVGVELRKPPHLPAFCGRRIAGGPDELWGLPQEHIIRDGC